MLADVFKNARANNLFMLGEQKRLAGLGYTQKALIDAIKQKVNFAFSELDTLAQNVMAEKDRAAALVLLTQTTFKKSSESEAQQIAFDLAVIAKLGILSPAERGSLSQGDLMPRLDSDRLQAALSRVPAEIHGLPADQVDLMRTIYAAKTWPRSTHATGLVGDMVAAAARAITSAVVTLEKLSGTPDGSLFNKLSGGKFFAEFRGGIAMTDSDFQAAKMAQRFTQGMPQAIIGDTFA
ncbi:hypothetical protein [Propionivibrio sp.]|uniref:hypothetical protein n=1 Tax=Propionivibrio sp. TaxID=2212460 RepID=UPI003BF47195